MAKFEVFLSYCWADETIAENIGRTLGENSNINLHQDKIDIGPWNSIKEYMQSISHMDYTILLISDAYLKSFNCMYEVLEVMRSRDYRSKIFPAVINSSIYRPATRAEYVKYWQNEYEKLRDSLIGIQPQNLGKLGEDLKRAQDISSNVAEFLETVADMNNPAIEDVSVAIEEKLREKNLISNASAAWVSRNTSHSLFDSLGISSQMGNTDISDFEINQFMLRSFQEINNIMEELCQQLMKQYSYYQVVTEKNDSINYFYQFYKAGKLIKNLRIFLDQSFGTMSIGISADLHSYGSGGNSWNGMYTAKNVNGKLCLSSQFSFVGKRDNMSVDDVVKDIWKNYINPYL